MVEQGVLRQDRVDFCPMNWTSSILSAGTHETGGPNQHPQRRAGFRSGLTAAEGLTRPQPCQIACVDEIVQIKVALSPAGPMNVLCSRINTVGLLLDWLKARGEVEMKSEK